MGVWYEVEKTPNGINDFMECNWEFHDFTIDRITYTPDMDQIEMFLKYDELDGSVFIRFLDVMDFKIAPRDRGYSSALMGSVLVLDKSGFFTWVSDDSYPAEEIDEAKRYATWIKSGKIIWAVTNAQGVPDEMPLDKIDQQWLIYDKAI